VAIGLFAVLLSGCGGSTPSTARPAPKATEFPAANGRTLAQIADTLDESPLVASPASQVFEVGENRYSFGVFTKGPKQVSVAWKASRGFSWSTQRAGLVRESRAPSAPKN
jgi:hypothetical protein